jgi:hypothetical protein
VVASPGSATAQRSATIREGDREKAYRPLPRADRRAALAAAVAAWDRGDWFETHELLEPAWMGTADPLERDLYQGLIKLAAAYVHAARGNAAGMTKNLLGADARLRRVAAARDLMEGIAVRRLVEDIGRRLPQTEEARNLRLQPPALSSLGKA